MIPSDYLYGLRVSWADIFCSTLRLLDMTFLHASINKKGNLREYLPYVKAFQLQNRI